MPTLRPVSPEAVLEFWFEELTPQQHFAKDAALDAAIGTRFGATLEAATRGELFGWRASPPGGPAGIGGLGPVSRNVWRGAQRAFAYMPYMHSESRVVHVQAVALFSQPGLEGNLPFALSHRAIIERFGRYPHRNAVLGRASTDEELAFLREPGSSF